MAKKNSEKAKEPSETESSLTTVTTDDPWLSNPALIRQFLTQQPDYEQLFGEVVYTLRKAFAAAGLKVASVTGRAKTLESFLEKVVRKSYEKPLEQTPDFAGARVVCYYPDDIPKIEKLIQKEFEVINREDKSKGDDRFGYNALHFLVRLGKEAKGARYDDLKDKVCEIQVRTVMQDAWAVFSHHLMYKHEQEIPAPLSRQINALAGALETADYAFQNIRNDRNAYVKQTEATSKADGLSVIPTNFDTVKLYLSQRYPRAPEIPDLLEDTFYITLFPEIPINKYPTLQDIDDLMSRTAKALNLLNMKTKPPKEFASLGILRLLRSVHIDLGDSALSASHAPEYKAAVNEVRDYLE